MSVVKDVERHLEQRAILLASLRDATHVEGFRKIALKAVEMVYAIDHLDEGDQIAALRELRWSIGDFQQIVHEGNDGEQETRRKQISRR